MDIPKTSLSRRRFIAQSLAAGGAVSVPWLAPSRALGLGAVAAPSERVTLGVIGYGPRCRHVLGCMLPEPDVQCVALCDVQASRREQGKAAVDEHYGSSDCALYRDLREMLARSDIDAVLVATGDRWHTPASILAAKAGKDIYSEKPCAINMAECRALAETMRRFGTVYQAGTQRRSIENFQVAVNLARSGKLGKLHTLHASVYTPRMLHDWLPAEPEPPKDVVDWDMWVGPSPWRPYNSAYVNGRWRGYPDFESGATLLDWGAHTVDLCQWANDADDTAPIEYEPSESNIIGRYANGVEVILGFLATPFGDRSPHWPNHLGTCPVRFVGEEGWIETGDSGDILVHPESLKSEFPGAAARRQGTDAGTHVRNFFDCVKTRARTNCDAETTRHSHLACYAAANSWMLGRKLTLDPATEEFIGDDEANRMRSRAAREPWGV
ncbi:MAG: Gfo/Idh/MocA family oxidoreductase [Thermoguttaceae bacterium]|jgi:predicted dehydrogenase|nr:Gfo/Idh/MocA family oxidoreductase [Thermoguttaceae bacterium]